MAGRTQGRVECPGWTALRSSQNFTNRLPAVRDRHRPAGAVVDHHFWIDPQAAIDRGTDVGRADRPVLDVGSVGVRSASNDTAADAGAGEEYGITISPVVTTAVG